MTKKYKNKLKRIWRQGNNPLRSLVFWGWNKKNEPSFLMLYGYHEFLEENSYSVDHSDIERFENTLCSEVTYTNYIVFDGMSGHLPSFESVNVVKDDDDDAKMYYKKDSQFNGWYRSLNEEGILEGFKSFEDDLGITIPYFEDFSYEELVEKVIDSDLTFEDFKFAKNPNEIIKLDEDLKEYYELLCVIMSNKNLNTRKKKLSELLSSNPDNRIYESIFRVGSVELLSGVFLECAKRNIVLSTLIDKAEYIVNEDISYSYESYVKGLKRCANIYLNSAIKERRIEREKWIYENLSSIDLHLVKLNGKEIKEGTILDGAKYRTLSYNEQFKEFYYTYERNSEGHYYTVEHRQEDMYKKGPFNDGVVFDLKAFKNIIQEAEAYNMADVIGKIAYYIDAPRLHYYFKGRGLSKELRYFKKYLRRILFDYAKTNEIKFMEAMKTLFTSYTEHDFLCKYKGNFQFNYFIKNILYYDFKEKPPVTYYDYDNHRYVGYDERYNFMKNNQLLPLEGRYEFMKEVWDNNLEDVLYIISNSKLDTIVKACYFIIKDSEKFNELHERMTYKELIEISTTSFDKLSQIFKQVITNKLDNEKDFDFNIMLELIISNDKDINDLGFNYLKRTNGVISCEQVVELILYSNLEHLSEFIISNIKSINPSDYIEFVKSLIKSNDLFKGNSFEIPTNINDEILLSINKIFNITKPEKEKLLKFVIDSILKKSAMEDFIESYLEEIIFSYSNEELEEMLSDFEFKYDLLSSRNNMIISLLNSIINSTIPSDSAIIRILETAKPKTLKTLFELVDKNENAMLKRFSGLLILLECNVVSFNEKSKEIFEKMDKEDKIKMHKFIIDSPVEKVYNFGLEKLNEYYFIPSDFIMQMFEHPSEKVKGYILDKSEDILNTLGKGDEDLFIYYAKTILLLPNKVRKNKEDVYDALYRFTTKYKNKYYNYEELSNDYSKIEELLFDMGSSNVIKDKEKALVTLAKIKQFKEALIEEVSLNESQV